MKVQADRQDAAAHDQNPGYRCPPKVIDDECPAGVVAVYVQDSLNVIHAYARRFGTQ